MNSSKTQTARILDGRLARSEYEKKLREKVKDYRSPPHLVIITIGHNDASEIYVGHKKAFGEKIGCRVSVQAFPAGVSAEVIEEALEAANTDPSIQGIIIQSPVPTPLSFEDLSRKINPSKDVDGLQPGSPFRPATARGILSLLSFYHIGVSGKRVVVIGRSHLAGRSIALALLDADATVTICHSKTANLMDHSREADMVIAALGKPQYLDARYFRPEQVVIDVGIHRKGGNLVGDVDHDSVEPLVSALSPVPGGVGPMTVLSLFENLIEAAEKSRSL